MLDEIVCWRVMSPAAEAEVEVKKTVLGWVNCSGVVEVMWKILMLQKALNVDREMAEEASVDLWL